MAIIIGPDFVLALVRSQHPRHGDAVALLSELDEDLVTSPLAVADIDRAVAGAAGDDARRAVWRDFERGAYAVRWWADALKALAGRLNTRRIATFDEQFRTLTTPDGEAFVVLPADR
jgi:predicted nucleic acid-binding protein